MTMRRTLLACVVAFGALGGLRCQDPSPPATATAPEANRAAIQARLDELKADEALPAELKTALLDVYGRALEAARLTEAQTTATADFTARAQGAPDELRAAREQLDRTLQPEPPAKGLSLAELEQGVTARTQAQTEAAAATTQLDAEARQRADRRASVPPLVAELRKQLDTLPEQVPAAAGVDPRLQAARQVLRTAERARVRSQLEALGAELAAFDAEEDLLRARRDLAARRVTAAKTELDAWQAALQQARAAAAQTAANQAQQQVGRTDPRIVKLAEDNARLADLRRDITGRLARAEVERLAGADDLRLLEEDFGEMQERARLVGETDAFGALLRKRRAWLADQARAVEQRARNRDDRVPDPQLQELGVDDPRRALEQRAHSRGDRITDAQLDKLDIDDRLRAVVRQLPRDWLQKQLGAEVVIDQLPIDVLEQAETLRRQRQEVLQQLSSDYGQLVTALSAIEATERQFVADLDAYRRFLTERVLGIRSSAPIWRLDPRALGDSLLWLGDGRAWLGAGAALAGVIGQWWPLALLLPLLALLALGPWLRRRLVVHGDLALRGTNVSYAPTALAAIDTLLLAVGPPALLWFVALCLRLANTGGEAGEFQKALAAGASGSAGLLGVVLLLRALARPRGLGEAHFRWQSTTLRLLRRNAPLLVPVALPIAFVLGMLTSRGDEAWLGSLGSLLLLAMFALLLVVAWRLLHPSRGLIGGAVARRPGALHRFRVAWFVLALGTVTTLLGMAVLGYDYTALQLSRRLLFTVAAVLAGVLINSLVVRGLVLERRRLQIRQAQERMAAQKSTDGAPTSAEVAPPVEDIDPQSLARQTQALLRGALVIAVLIVAFRIWVDVLPALGILRNIELWTVDDASGSTPIRITLADVLLSLFTLFAAVVAARNVPALLELLVLQRFRMPAGERNAITTLTRYGIVIVGVVLAFSAIGVGWSKVQWLLAAVSVGLGFGLQEIFANFVSGLILLFERPIRVGDLVSVGDVIGRVNRIRIRATTIVDWDRKELVVPNREFVTGRFVNWTLTDSVVRWVIPVGVAYGSDTEQALRLLDRAAAESPFVLEDPRPEAVFVGFGDSTLNLHLRVFVDMSALDYRWMTDLHQAIDRLFREHGIEIAFPQRDVNLKAAGPLLEALTRRPGDVARVE
ncbi:MAG: mechanosensitive ion channel domain-containing protein [Planctomycetota bacterium]